MKQLKSIAIGAALFTSAGLGCGSDDNSGPLGNVDALIILQRPKRNDMGDIFQYTSYIPGAKLVKLSPPTADGTLTTICCDQSPDLAGMDIQNYDLSFDATQIVFAGHSATDQNYGIYLLTLADGSVTQLATDPGRDYVSPIFLPGDKIMFTTNSVVSNPVTDPNPAQHRDEYERGTTIQMGTMNLDGTNEQLGPRNLSHRTMPSLASDGRVIFTQWDHLGPENAGHLMFMGTDMTNLREAFGKEGTAASNSTLKAQEIAPGRFVGIATSRDRTIQSGALIDIRLGFPSTDPTTGIVRADTAMSEADASYVMLTPDVPLDNTPSASTVGRYYDAYPLNAGEHPDLLVSWADGPVESSVLDAAGLSANFGIYLYDTTALQRHPILDDPSMWDIFARPLQPHAAPPATDSQSDGTLGPQALIGTMDVYTSTLHSFVPGSIYGVRVMEGFSSEEGFPEMFGTTMFEGHAGLGVARVAADGSWLAKVPANVPIHLQAIDKFGMSLFNEPVWFSARAGESRVCGGCHENRATATIINPGITQAAAIGPLNAMGMVPRSNREMATGDLLSSNLIQADGTGIEKLVGMGWGASDPTTGGTGSIQQVFTDNCVSCHDKNNSAGIQGYTIQDAMGNVVATWTFNLSADPVTVNYGPATDDGPAMQTYSASYFTMAGPDMEAIEMNNLVITGNFKVYMNPEDAHGSLLMQKINPTQLFPQPDANVRAYPGTTPHSSVGYTSGRELTATEFYKLILAADMGVNYYARENNPHSSDY